jgi:hypothetical protein
MFELRFEPKTIDRLKAALAGSYRRLPEALDRATGKVALELAAAIQRGIRSGAPGGQKFKPLAKSTIAMKRSSKALIDHGDLIRSIGARRVAQAGNPVWFVGVHRSAKDKDGTGLYNLAELHEFGGKPYDIRVTPKMRAWWAYMASKGIFKYRLAASTHIIHHKGMPARPFLRPTFAVWSQDVSKRWGDFVMTDLLKGWK